MIKSGFEWEKDWETIQNTHKSKIMRLTKKFRFDLREFHRTILRCLGPLSAVEECVAAFVENFDQFFDSGGSRVPEPEIASSSGRISGILILVLMSVML